MESVNLEHIREATMGDDEFLAELIDLFLNDTPAQLEALRKAVRTGDAERATSAAHRLRGSSGNMGAESLSACASTWKSQVMEINSRGCLNLWNKWTKSLTR